MTARTVMGSDFGMKRLGNAVGQELTKTASPLTTLRLTSSASSIDLSDTDWQAIDGFIKEWQPQAIVVGLPLMADGGETDVTRGAKAFGEALQKRYNLETYWVDERLTSVEAESMIAASNAVGKGSRKTGKKASKRDKGEIDRMAAKLILESWFQQQPG